MASIYVDNFLLASNAIVSFKALKKVLGKKYEINNLGELKTINGWQITRDPAMQTMKINYSTFIRDFIIKKEFTNCNANILSMKRGSAIEINDSKD